MNTILSLDVTSFSEFSLFLAPITCSPCSYWLEITITSGLEELKEFHFVVSLDSSDSSLYQSLAYTSILIDEYADALNICSKIMNITKFRDL